MTTDKRMSRDGARPFYIKLKKKGVRIAFEREYTEERETSTPQTSSGRQRGPIMPLGKEHPMDETRREQLREQLYQETNDPESWEWRDELTPDELDYVETLDEQYITGVVALSSAILVREQVRARFRPEEIAELETIRDHCRVRLRDGRLYLARLDRNRELLLEELDGVC